jgi:peptide/nickel transport system permease protein
VNYFIRRIVLSLFVILGVLFVTFLVSRVVPGVPAGLYAGMRA